MRQLTCEMCGSTDLIKQDGVFVCQTCGCKYSVEEAKRMMVEGIVDVQGTVKIDNSDKYNNVYQLAYDAFIDGRWDSAYNYCNEALLIRPDAPTVMAMQGLSILGKEKIVTDVPSSCVNAMKRMLSSLETAHITHKEKIKALDDVIVFVEIVRKAKETVSKEEISALNAQKVDYSAKNEKLAQKNAIAQVFGGNVFTQQKAEADLDKHRQKRLHNEALDAQISKINSFQRKVDSFASAYTTELKSKISSVYAEMRELERIAKEERIAAYWDAHKSEKAHLESEVERLNGLLVPLCDEESSVSAEKHLYEAKLKEKVPAEVERDKVRNNRRALERRRANLGIFKGEEKKRVQSEIDASYAKERELENMINVQKETLRSEIIPQVEELDSKLAELSSSIAGIRQQLQELNEELMKDRVE